MGCYYLNFLGSPTEVVSYTEAKIMRNKISENVINQIRQDLNNLYKSVSKELSQLSAPCRACGFCCHFGEAKHYLYASTLESIYIFDKYHAKPMHPNSHVCPFLKNEKCSIRDRRMLGCRTYFRLHTKKEKIKAEEIYEHNLLILKQLHNKYKIDWNYQDCILIFQRQFGIIKKMPLNKK